MGVQIASSSAAFNSGNVLIPGLPSGLITPLIWSYLAGSLAASQNQGNGGALSNIGAGPTYPTGTSPTYGAGYASFQGNPTAGSALALQGPADPGGSFTIMFAAQNTFSAGPGQIISSEPTGAGNGTVISLNNGSTGVSLSIKGAAIATTWTVPGGTLTWSMYAVVFTSAVGATIYDLGRAANSGLVTTTFGRTVGTAGWQIGTSLGASADAHLTNIAWLANYQAALNTTQMNGIYATIKAVLKYRGVLLP